MSLDWSTLIFQTVNVAVLIWLLSRLFWRPLAGAIAARQAETESVLKEAETRRAAAETLREGLARDRDDIAAERQQVLKTASTEAERQRDAILAEAHKAAKETEAAARAAIAQAQRDAEAQLQGRAVELAVALATRLGREMDGPALREASLEKIAEGLARLPEAERQTLAANGGVVLATPAALTPDEEARARDRLSKALGGAATIGFRTDPALVAGFELEGRHITLSNSWRDGLARLRAEIARDE